MDTAMKKRRSANVLSALVHSAPGRLAIGIIAPMGIFSILLLMEGLSPLEAYSTIFSSVFGSMYGFGEVVIRATYLILTAVASVLPGRVGLANAGGEGQMAIGAIATAIVASTTLGRLIAPLSVPMLLLTGMLCGAIWAGIGVFFRMKMGMNEILTTILMNYIATYFISMLLFGPVRDPHGWNYPQTVEVRAHLRLPTFFGTRMNVGIFISIAVALLCWLVIYKSKVGFTLRTIGGNQLAAHYAGIRVKRVQTAVFLIAGAIAGLAGAIMVLGAEGRMRLGAGETMGFMGFLAAGMVRNNPVMAIFSAFLIAGLNVAGNSMEINTGLPAASIQILIMLVLLTIMVMGERRRK